MSNRFLVSSIRAVNTHGLPLVYQSITTAAYDVETGSAGTTTVDYTVKMYPKQFIATTYNYPTLVGKETCMFYLANNSLGFVPKVNDSISYQGKNYKVISYQQHFAAGEVVFYRLIGVHG